MPFRADIQGLRALAVTLVVLYHAGVPALAGGYVGVDVFFVISGFLITTHLLEGHRGGGVSLRSFYARRARRILPASMVVLVATFGAALWIESPLRVDSLVEDAAATALYVPNLLFAHRGTDYLADVEPTPFQHYWSLGIEEQFYLVWPAALAAAWWVADRRRRRRAAPAAEAGGDVRRTGHRAATVAIATVVAASFLGGLAALDRSQPEAFFLLPNRAWELGVGGLVAALLTRPGRRAPAADGMAATARAATAWAGLALVAAAALTYDEATRFPGWAALLPVAGTAAVIAAGAGAPVGGPARLLSLRPAQTLGTWSYSVYLWHWPLLVLGAAAAPGDLSLTARLGLAAAAVPLAAATYRLVEQPARTSARLADRPGATIGLALAASAALVGLVLTGGRWAESRPLHVEVAVPNGPLTVPPTPSPVVSPTMAPDLRAAEDDLPDVYDDGCQLDWEEVEPEPCTYGDPDASNTVTLFGDSHAASWSPALERYAAAHDLRLTTHTKRSCPSVSVTKRTLGNRYTACDRWRDRVLEQLRDDPPDLVVITNTRHHDLVDPTPDPRAAWSEGLEETLDRLAPETRVVVIADTPHLDRSARYCLSEHLDDTTACARDRRSAISMRWMEAERAATVEHGGRYVDLNRYLCSDRCWPVISNRLVYRDHNHLTATFAAELAEPLAEELAEAGISWPS